MMTTEGSIFDIVCFLCMYLLIVFIIMLFYYSIIFPITGPSEPF